MDKLKRISLALMLVACMALSACSSTDAGSPPSDANSSAPQTSQSQQADSSTTPDSTADDSEPSDAGTPENTPEASAKPAPSTSTSSAVVPFSLSSIPAFTDQAYIAVNNNEPYFTDADKARTDAFETYSSLDSLGRCGVAYANICHEIMPTEARGEIGSVKPSGWQTAKYDFVDGKYLYNRCHLIGFQLAGENANNKNLITGTRYLNIEGMLPFENMVDDYVDETNNHVIYRVTPVFDGNNLVASGVLIEGWSVEDQGDGICFCVYAYNNQPGVEINYATGDNWTSGAAPSGTTASGGGTSTPVVGTTTNADSATTTAPAKDTSNSTTPSNEQTYILNTNSKKFHYPSCSSVDSMSEANKKKYTGTRDALIADGYDPCGRCKP